MHTQLLGTDPLLECFATSHFAVTATFFLGLYLVLAVILLINMLIAMMAKTFDLVWEQQALNFQQPEP